MVGHTENIVEWIEDERGGGVNNPLAGGTKIDDDLDGLDLVRNAQNEIFHCRTIHVTNAVNATNGVGIYESPLGAGNLRRRFRLAARETLEITGLFGLRFRTSVIVNVTTTSSLVFVHIGGISRLN